MDEEEEWRLVEIMDEENRGRRKHRALAVAITPLVLPSTSSTVSTPSEQEVASADSSPAVRRNNGDADEAVVVDSNDRRATTREPSRRSEVVTVEQPSSRLLASATVRSKREVENNDEEEGEEKKEEKEKEYEQVEQPVREVSKYGSEATLIQFVLGRDRVSVDRCKCRPDMEGATSETAWEAIDCCLYNRQRAERSETATEREENRFGRWRDRVANRTGMNVRP